MNNDLTLLEQLPNIGKVLAQRLEQIGIHTEEELQTLGAEQVFLQIKTIDEGACLSQLCAIEGAIQGIRWHNLDKLRKYELNEFYKMTQKNK